MKTTLTAFGIFAVSACTTAYVVAGVAPQIPGIARFIGGSLALGGAVFLARQIRGADDGSLYLGITVIGVLCGTFAGL